MKKLPLLGVAAVLSTVLATPLMAQGATQEPGMIGFNYPNSDYLTGGYGVRLPYNTGRFPRMPYYRQAAWSAAPSGRQWPYRSLPMMIPTPMFPIDDGLGTRDKKGETAFP
jgi:hypothetical protein